MYQSTKLEQHLPNRWIDVLVKPLQPGNAYAPFSHLRLMPKQERWSIIFSFTEEDE